MSISFSFLQEQKLSNRKTILVSKLNNEFTETYQGLHYFSLYNIRVENRKNAVARTTETCVLRINVAYPRPANR